MKWKSPVVDSKMCDPTAKMCVADNRTTDAPPQISFSGTTAEANGNGGGSGASSEAQPIHMSRKEEHFDITEQTFSGLSKHLIWILDQETRVSRCYAKEMR